VLRLLEAMQLTFSSVLMVVANLCIACLRNTSVLVDLLPSFEP
jgi:hypothetical protein